jgi:hypothetical protein
MNSATRSLLATHNAVYNAEAFSENCLLVASGSYTRAIGRVTSTSTPMFSRHELDPDSGYWNVFTNMATSFKYAYGSMAKAEQQLSWKPRPSIAMTTGGTFERFFAIPQGADLNAPIQSHLDRRYLTINPRAYTNLEELNGAPQNPRRLTVGFSLRVR